MSSQVGKIIFDMPKRHKKIESAAVERLVREECRECGGIGWTTGFEGPRKTRHPCETCTKRGNTLKR